MENKKDLADIEGFILLHRKILKSAVFYDSLTFQLWIYILLRANFEDKKIFFNGDYLDIKRGEFITSIKTILKDLKLPAKNRQKIRSRLEVLNSTNKITTKATNKFTLIKVNKYNDYQLNGKEEKPTEKPIEKKTSNQPVTTDNKYNEFNEKKKNSKKKNFKFRIENYLNEKQKIKFQNLPDFVIYKFKSFDFDDFVLISLYFFEGYNFQDRFKLENDLKGEKERESVALKKLKKYKKDDILQAMANISQKASPTLKTTLESLEKAPEQHQDQASKARQELAKALNFPF